MQSEDQSSGVRIGVVKLVPISDLRLDPHNPRLPESHRGGEQVDLAVILELGFEALAVAQSIADNGYFAAEPLIAIRGDGEGTYVVVEGNRRLTALLGLADAQVRSEFNDAAKWEEVAGRAGITLGTTIPIVIHENRDATHVEVSRAHVVGKLQWRPYMQARFIAARVAEGRTLAQVADLIGITKSRAADLYRDQAIVVQAEQVGLNTGEVEKAFSVLTVTMGNTKIRSHVGAPLGSRLEPGDDPIPADKVENLRELIGWVFGDEENEPVINDSRQVSKLGNVVASETGVNALRAGKTLEEAMQLVQSIGMDPHERLLKRLTSAYNALTHASDDLAEFADDRDVATAVSDIESLLESFRNVMDEAQATA